MRLDGHGLEAEHVVQVARHGLPVELDPGVPARMAAAREVVERYLADGRPAYGLTTGLGARVVEGVPTEALAEFSRHTILGRANSVGPPLATDVVRAAMLVRANGLARGGSGARPELALALVALLGRGVHPIVPSIGSVGAGDICMLAHIGLVLLGEGEAELGGETLSGAHALEAAGLVPFVPAPKDGLSLISANAVSAAFAALALADGREALDALQVAAALSMEGFRASRTPLDERVVSARPAPGQAACAAVLRELLDGGSSVPRRLQDPLSFRCVSQTHGSLAAALEFLAVGLEPELNGAGDNPLVLAEDGEIVSTGNFFVPALALAADTVALALAQVANLAAARVARLLSATLTDLPQNLAPPGSTGTGMAPLLKASDALASEIAHGAAPVSLDSRAGASSVEDASTGAPLATGRLNGLLERLRLLVALELVVAAQAVDLAGIETLGRGTGAAYAVVRELVVPLESDKPLGADVGRVAAELGRVLAATAGPG
ncbi:MAG: aromatic amino acid lyase [Actinomycetota bacterium]|nr:aromatic amino acid lyase [Actinomycetota bacterium]